MASLKQAEWNDIRLLPDPIIEVRCPTCGGEGRLWYALNKTHCWWQCRSALSALMAPILGDRHRCPNGIWHRLSLLEAEVFLLAQQLTKQDGPPTK